MTTERIETILEHTAGPTVLDLGAVQHDADNATQNDWLHDYLVRQFDRVIGVDILAENIERLNNRGYEMVHADVEQMELPIKADTVVAGELIEHLSNPGLMLNRAHDHLRDGGRFVLSTPNPWAFVHLRRWLTNSMQVNDEHTAWFGPIVLEQLLNRHGFDNVHITGVSPGRPWWSVTNAMETIGGHPFDYTTWVVVAERTD